MLQTQCFIRDYNASADTCSIEVAGLGTIEAWVDGVAIAANVDRSLLVFGAQALVNLPDLHRLCGATVVQVYGATAQSIAGIPPSSTAAVKKQTGRAQVFTDGAGNATGTITFPQAFTNTPQVSLAGDSAISWTISGLLNTQFTFTLAAARSPNSYVFFTWSATGV